MHIKLISPAMSLRPMDTELKIRMSPPLSLLILGALTPREHTVELADENVETIRLDDAPDLVAITVKVDTARRSYAIAAAYRKRGVPVVLGGIHPTACPDEAAEHCDAVFMGEAELLWGELLADASVGTLKPRYYQAEPVDPSLIPVPRWEMLRGKDYLWTNTLTTSRGCPWRCKFCYNSSPHVPNRHRVKPAGLVAAEVDSLGTRHVFFVDDNFIGSPARAAALLDEMEAMNLTWNTAVSADILDHPDLMDRMAACGCKSLFIGFESFSEANLRSCAKRQNHVERYDQLVKAVHDRGMMVNASLVFGFDHDGPDVFEKTLRWLVEHRIESLTAHILTPYPGTAFYEELRAEGRIVDEDYRRYNTAYAVFEPRGMSREELTEGYHWMYREFYSWRNILRRAPGGAQQRTAYWLFNLAYRKCGKLTSRLARVRHFERIGRWARHTAYKGVR